MKKNNVIIISIILSLFLCLPVKTDASMIGISHRSSDSSESAISPYNTDICWKYKVMNGVLCKRQYNYTTNKWIGDWVKA